ncbi:hypothetical protein [Actinomadura sp. WMMA1423]|uniref:hypothetical protein n=1 Tax=Actinomadura sp. WMMA1423 TaxID=2591108 RepID=UPI0011461A12|nr:hypothetical protein [Actinomadura sp. WMMA1423]
MENPLWNRLPAEVRAQVDALVLDDQKLAAVKAVLDASREPRTSLHECSRLVAERCAALGRRFRPAPSAPLDLEDLVAEVRALPRPPAAVEALWDGDTEGWFVVLVGVTLDPKTEHHLATVRHGGDIRAFNGEVPPWPEAEEASRIGAALAGRLDVPFHFASPGEPDDTAPRWWDSP